MRSFFVVLAFMGFASKGFAATQQQPTWMLQIQEQGLPNYNNVNGLSLGGRMDGLDLSYFSSARNNWGLDVRTSEFNGYNEDAEERFFNPRYRRYSKEGLWRPFFQVGLLYLNEWFNPDHYPKVPSDQLSLYALGGDVGFGVGRVVRGVAVEFLLDERAMYSPSPYGGTVAYSNYHFGLGYAW